MTDLLRGSLGVPEPDPFKRAPTIGETTAAAFRLNNPVYAVMDAFSGGVQDVERGFNPLNEPGFKGSKYEQRYLDAFMGTPNRAMFERTKSRIDSQEADKETYEAGGAWGTVAGLGSALLDPTMFVPIGGAVRAIHGGYSIARTARNIGVASGLQAGVSEAALLASQETKSWEEGAIGVATGTLLGAILGSGVAAIMTRAERRALTASLDVERPLMTPGMPDPPGRTLGINAAAGAAQSDIRQLELKSFFPEWFTKFVPPSVQDKFAFARKSSPTLRILTNPFIEARRGLGDLVEIVLRTEDEAMGLTTSQYGTTIDRMARREKTRVMLDTANDLREAYTGYRWGDAPPTAPMLRATVADMTGASGDKLSFNDFKAEVYRALYSGDKHADPSVERAAKAIRANALKPLEERLKATKNNGLPMLGEDALKPRGDESFAPRTWNTRAITANRPDVVERFTNFYAAEQARKAEIKERLETMWARKSELDAQTDKLDAVIERLKTREAKTEGAAAEAERTAERTMSRVETLVERVGNAQAKASEVAEFVAEMRKVVTDKASLRRLDELEGEAKSLVQAEARLSEADMAARPAATRAETLRDRATLNEMKRDITNEAIELARKESDDLRAKMEEEIRGWQGNSVADALSALKQRDKVTAAGGRADDAPRLRSADRAIDQAIRRILDNDRDLSPEELTYRANQTVERIIADPGMKLSYEDASAQPAGAGSPEQYARGSTNSRDFAIPTKDVFDYVEHDIEHAVNRMYSTLLPDALIAERFGDVEMSTIFRKLEDEHIKLQAEAKTPAARNKLDAQYKETVQSLSGVRDRVRGTFAVPTTESQRTMATWVRRFQRYNVITDLGSAPLNSASDMLGISLRYGVTNTFRDAWIPFMAGMVQGGNEFTAAAKRQAKTALIAVETWTNMRMHAMNDVLDHELPGSKFDRGMALAADRSQLVNMQAPYTDFTKMMATTIVGAEMTRVMEKISKGTASAADIGNLAGQNISKADAEAIWKQFQNGGGEKINGVWFSDTAKWTDARLREVYEGALAREADIAVVTPGAEKPFWLSKPLSGLLGQFKGFVAATHERTLLAQMQQRDGRTLAGLFSMVAMGIVSYRLYTLVSDQPFNTDPSHLIKEGMSRSGVTGWLDEINAIQSKAMRGQTDMYRLIGADKPLSRFASRGAITGLAGPTYGKAEGLVTAMGAAGAGEFTGSDTTKIRRLVPIQNNFFLRNLLNEAEEGINEFLGIPQKPPPRPPASASPF